MSERAAVRASAAGDKAAVPDSPRRSAIWRLLAFFGLWLLLMQSFSGADMVFGAVVAAAATLVSLRLSPPACGCLRFTRLLLFLPHFLWQSVLAGTDVARRALSPRVRLHPGLVVCPLGFPPGMARNTFATITSLLPGTVPCAEAQGELVYHCLDTTQPVVQQLWDEECRLGRALVAGRSHG